MEPLRDRDLPWIAINTAVAAVVLLVIGLTRDSKDEADGFYACSAGVFLLAFIFYIDQLQVRVRHLKRVKRREDSEPPD